MAAYLRRLVCGMLGLAAVLAAAQPTTITVDRDNVKIAQSCRIEVSSDTIPDTEGNGVIHIVADNIAVEFDREQRGLIGAAADTPWDKLTGIGIRITGQRNVTIRGARIVRYQTAIWASEADGLTLEHCDVSDGYAMRLGSTPQAEDPADWLWPHENDDGEWRTRYGAGICVERSNGVVIRDCFARRRQNGIILDRVMKAKVYDNDCSFLSGWGLAMWRSSSNVISRNAFDFCVRGYSHGVYNRGQDSAGILMFEQCCDNTIAENSATHGGDGFFGFAGKEALGEKPPPATAPATPTARSTPSSAPTTQFSYRGRGCNNNRLINNDFSYAPAHGIELTFSFGNRFIGNRLVENAICGIWGGYSQETLIAGNVIEGNGEMAYGLERGGVNIEHGRENVIRENQFRNNKCAIHLWWDNDEGILKTPWAQANDPLSRENRVVANTFEDDALVLHLRNSQETLFAGNRVGNVGKLVEATPGSEPEIREFEELGPRPSTAPSSFELPDYTAHGDQRPVGARPELRGRDKIIMTEWFPYDWRAPLLQFVGPQVSDQFRSAPTVVHLYRLLGRARHVRAQLTLDRPGSPHQFPEAELEITDRGEGADPNERPTYSVIARPGHIVPYTLTVETDQGPLTARGTIIAAPWHVTTFAYQTDPREDVEAWRKESANGHVFRVPELRLRYGMGGPSQLREFRPSPGKPDLPRDRFGTIATARVSLPLGKWRIRTTSDDGVRVWADDELLIDNWTHHGPTVDTAELTVTETRPVKLRVEHFELDGYAVLECQLERAEAPAKAP